MSSPHVAICIATFRRPDGLRRLLDSLNVLSFSTTVPRITVVIVDNDASSTLTADDIRVSFPCIYAREPRQGLANVRNACLDALPPDADFCAFLDDDEWVEPDWLQELLAMQSATGAEIVQGVVRPAYPRRAPQWMILGRYHEVGPFSDGEELTHGASGNVLIERRAIVETLARFHPDFNVSGGEDVDFFQHLRACGCRIVAASQAIAHESVPLERMTLAWILRRRYRTGHTLGLIAQRQGGVAVRLAKATARIGIGCLESIGGLLLSRTHGVRGLTNIAWGLGTIAAFAHMPTVGDRRPQPITTESSHSM